ncbi:MAG: hypothetical protein IJ448_00440 [Oscillospiraceae bacterium]|nr:hypothetical protein [Oscillospiraceae bacterium]
MREVLVHSFVNESGTEIAVQEKKQPAKAVAPETAQQLRQIAVDYMYKMAKVVWTSNQRIDYSFNNESLIYEAGKTYVGMIYNNCRNGLEAFREALDEKGVYQLEDIGWDTAPGNSCATSIRHAWQMISPDVEYQYSIDMMPYYKDTGVQPIGDIDWTLYDGKNTTNSIVKNTDKNVILEAYALAQPADGFMRYLDTGGHALMVTLPPVVVRNADGTIDPEASFVFLTDQNNKMNTFRDYPSSWKVDRQVSFEKAYTDGWLPVTVKELQEGNAPAPVFEISGQPTAAALAAGHGLAALVKSNYCIMTLRAELRREGQLLQEAQLHPYKREVSLENLAISLKDLPAGAYQLSVSARVGLGGAELFNVDFSR